MDLRVAPPILARDGLCDDSTPTAAWFESVRTLPQCFDATYDRAPGRVAVEVGPVRITYAQLDRRGNQLAHLLGERGVTVETPVGILLDRSEETYVALLGVLKAGAAYVPLDPSFPADLLSYIAEDSGLHTLVTMTAFREVTGSLPCTVLELDDVAADLVMQPTGRPDVTADPEGVCYVIYTLGSTGKAKGVAISHLSIVNFLQAATPIFGVTADDRVYQGMSISSDFHLEEMWPAWVAGATLVAGPTDSRPFGQELTDFLTRNQVTVFCAGPTVLTTVKGDPSSVRCLLVSGEPMPADLVRRWHRPGRRILNCYGPTETTVASSYCELLPDRPVTLGKPFPTYAFYILGENLRPVPDGEVGEICIGGPGIGLGYLNLRELTAERFIHNPIASDRTEVPRIYRTGDLARLTPSGEYEYLGRTNNRVKIRGYRTEPGEIEHHATSSVLVNQDADNTTRWRPGERLEHYFEQRCDAVSLDHPAVVAEDGTLTFRELDDRSNQAARHFLECGLKAGHRIGVLLDKSVDCYVALLAILKVGAAYVPLDPSFPADRIDFIIDDAQVEAIVSVSAFEAKLASVRVPRIFQDTIGKELRRKPAHRLADHERPSPQEDQLFYIIYTSGTTGKPKGVAIEHLGICNFVKVVGELYGYRPDDRCYQGMTLAFDFHVEDLWTPLIAGATLVAGKSGGSLFGADLHAYLSEQRVTVLPCVPTLWATIENDLPDVRVVQLSGEAVPHHLVVRWHRPGRRILNAYGPTECSVSSTLRVLEPDSRVTIGVPLPTYTVVILDEHRAALAPPGAMGEIGIAGPGLARGYLNREALTEQKFIPDFLDIPNNPSHRIYRTGDYGRIADDGELEFHGRIDTQVKLRGYRIELGEIEAVLAQDPAVAQAVVSPCETEPGSTELVAYYTRKHGAPELSLPGVIENLRRQLPTYMIPGYLEELPAIPMTNNHKADRKALPAPRGPRLAISTGGCTAPRTETETVLAEALIDVMNLEQVSVTDDFFKDLGAHSLLMASFSAEIRKRMNLPSVSMREIYLHPNLEALAQRLELMSDGTCSATVQTSDEREFYRPPAFDYWLCGGLQALSLLGWSLVTLWLFVKGIAWAYEALPDLTDAYLRMLAYSLGMFVIYSAAPLALKWLLIGHWQPESIPIWSIRYFRFWLVKTFVRIAPMAIVGGPVRNLYLQLLGARIGANAVIQSRSFPITTDLVSIGAHTVLAKDSIVQGYKARSNYIHIGYLNIGSNASVGEASVVDINTVMEDNSQLGLASSLHEGQRIPAGKHFHGSPAVETTANYCDVEARQCGALRRWIYALGLFLPGFATEALFMTLLLVGAPAIWERTVALENEVLSHDVTLVTHCIVATLFSLAVFVGLSSLRFLTMGVVPRLLNLFLRENRTYVLYGFHYFIQQMISGISNSIYFNRMLGDTSAVVHYLRWVGYNLNTVVQTGSNFGMSQKHENPLMVDIGSGTMVSGGVKFVNETMSSDAFKVGMVTIGEQNYLGNYLHIPSNSVVGVNCLVATKALTPIQGPALENIGLLGAPAFEIPRATARDLRMSQFDEATRRRRLQAKNRYNFVTVVLFLLHNWVLSLILTVGVLVAIASYLTFGILGIYLAGGLTLFCTVLWMWLVERGVLRFGSLQPRIVPLLDPYFWFHERHWKLTSLWIVAQVFGGTPIKNLISRLQGVRLGRMVFDDGADIDEYTLVEIGDYTNLNTASVIQPHSLEEGVFKSGRVKLGVGCTLGAAGNVHYDVTMDDFVVIEPNSFVMKGESIERGATWIGNPAQASTTSMLAVSSAKKE